MGWRLVASTLGLILAPLSSGCSDKRPPRPDARVEEPPPAAASPFTASSAALSTVLPKGPQALFPLLFLALERTPIPPSTILEYEKTTVADALRIVRSELPMKPGEVFDEESHGEQYRFVQAKFEGFFVVFKFGNQPDAYRGKLYEVAFTVVYPGTRVPERETRVFRAIEGARGRPSRVEKFRYSDTSVNEDLNLHVWEAEDAVITYRAYHDEKKNQDTVVTNLWDPAFHRTHRYWDH
jgi:hypothetical protein